MSPTRALGTDLIDRDEAAFLPSDQCVPERASPWWHGSAAAIQAVSRLQGFGS